MENRYLVEVVAVNASGSFCNHVGFLGKNNVRLMTNQLTSKDGLDLLRKYAWKDSKMALKLIQKHQAKYNYGIGEFQGRNRQLNEDIFYIYKLYTLPEEPVEIFRRADKFGFYGANLSTICEETEKSA